MAEIADFRSAPFDIVNVKANGKHIGRVAYPQLFLVENVFRVIIHSVLSAQLGANWWSLTVDQKMEKRINDFRNMYSRNPWHTAPGSHDIYYLSLGELNKIATSQSIQIAPLIPDIDHWTLRIEQLRLPQNIVCHMNYLSKRDRNRIAVLASDFEDLLRKLATSSVPLLIP